MRRCGREIRMKQELEIQRRENMLMKQQQQMLIAMQQLLQQVKEQNRDILIK